MLANAVITIFNRFPKREEKKFVYVPHVIPRAWFYTNQKSSVGERGLSSADEYKIRIPYEECKQWLPENDFKELANTKGRWTVQNGDFFLVGNWNKGEVKGIEEIKKEFSGTVGKVFSHSENFFGSSKHIRIGGGS